MTPEFEALLEFLRSHRGFDFTGYKRNSLFRRMTRRLQVVGLSTFEDYQDYLEVHPDEFAALFDTILINVTDFFRDRLAWRHVAERIVPKILAAKNETESVRAWSAACSTGQEAYSLAMLLAEALGPEAFRKRVKIYATDVDEEALAIARQGQYRLAQMTSVPPSLLAKYFERNGDTFTFRNEFRRAIIFGRHDLVSDAPIGRVDLLACRNVLMYF